MKSNWMFSVGSKICQILFYVLFIVTFFIIMDHAAHLWFPDSGFTQSLGPFQPIFGLGNIYFDQDPELYTEKGFIALSFLSNLSVMVLAHMFLWYMHRLLRNVGKNSLFMYENVAILFRLGLFIIVMGCLFSYSDDLLFSKALNQLDITNGLLIVSTMSYIDFILGGLVLLIIAFALKKAVHAVEENKNTI
ncbi:DUF2975 domain-containing protein [Paenibacillus sp. QZ-Y1]|uniref:DUF2975 domain-containing protein n=1 Tax=Paenibacillus sp. QZ-Y1 TaxID=3414511 RepID=UPI003F79CB90